MTNASAICKHESDGFHQHEYRSRHASGWTQIVTEHLHTWTAEHLERWPDAKPVDVTTGSGYIATYELLGKYDTLAEAWAAHCTGDIPPVECAVPRG